MTTLVRFREPLRNVAMNGEFERLIKTIFESPARAAVSNNAWTPPLDVWEKIVVELGDGALTVSGSREHTELEDGRFFRYERPFGEFTRSLALPEGTDDVEARAHYANGVLEVHVEKREQSKPRRLPVTTTVESGSID
jgi:HSP20 family protein